MFQLVILFPKLMCLIANFSIALSIFFKKNVSFFCHYIIYSFFCNESPILLGKLEMGNIFIFWINIIHLLLFISIYCFDNSVPFLMEFKLVTFKKLILCIAREILRMALRKLDFINWFCNILKAHCFQRVC